MSVFLPSDDTAAPKTVEEIVEQRTGQKVESDFPVDRTGFREFSPEFGAPVGGDEVSRNQFVRDLTSAAVSEGWDPIFGSGLSAEQFMGERLSYSSAGAQPIARKASATPGNLIILYSDGTQLEVNDGPRGAGGGMGGRSYSGAGGFEGAAAQFGMGGDGSPGSRAARDAATLLARQYGFDASFFGEIENLLFEGISEESLTLALRQTAAYKKRFAANATRVAKGLPALSESEYIRMESLYRQELRAAGLPAEFYDDMNDFKTYIENDISYNEFVGRVGLARRASQMANPEVKRQLKDLYNVGDSDLVAYFLNPQKTSTMLQRQFNVAQTAGALSKAGFGTNLAEELTSSVLGGRPETVLDYGELETAAQTAATARPLSMQVLGGEGGAVAEQDLLRGVVAQDVQSQRKIQREQQRRLAEYQGGGSLVESQQGVLGLRSATR